MGNRTYLNIKTTDGICRNLFEGNSSLAYFWLMLLDRADIENVRVVYRHAFSSYDTFQQTDTSITVDQKSALANAAGRLKRNCSVRSKETPYQTKNIHLI